MTTKRSVYTVPPPPIGGDVCTQGHGLQKDEDFIPEGDTLLDVEVF